MYVYQITNTVNGKLYIGITQNIERRWKEHRKVLLESNKEYNKVLYRAIRKYGIENFKFEVLFDNLDISEAESTEIMLIKELNTLSHNNGYNVTTGGCLGGAPGEANSHAKLTTEQARTIISRRENGETLRSVYLDYESILQFTGMQSIWSGQSWKHLQPKHIHKPHGGRKLSETQVREIRELLGTTTGRALAAQFGVTPTTISEIKTGRKYNDIH